MNFLVVPRIEPTYRCGSFHNGYIMLGGFDTFIGAENHDFGFSSVQFLLVYIFFIFQQSEIMMHLNVDIKERWNNFNSL